MALNPNEEMKMTYSSVVVKEGKPMVSLTFERGRDMCEAVVPECIVTKNDGFTSEETEAIEQYLRINKKQIILDSKKISGLFNIMK